MSSEQFVKRHAKRVKISAIKRGKDETQPAHQRYQCKTCNANFDDLNNTIFAGHYQPLRMWILCLYLMELNLSNRQIAQELDLDKDVVQDMTTQFFPVRLSGSCSSSSQKYLTISSNLLPCFNCSLAFYL